MVNLKITQIGNSDCVDAMELKCTFKDYFDNRKYTSIQKIIDNMHVPNKYIIRDGNKIYFKQHCAEQLMYSIREEIDATNYYFDSFDICVNNNVYDVRFLEIDGEKWYLAKDVANALEYKKHASMMLHVLPN